MIRKMWEAWIMVFAVLVVILFIIVVGDLVIEAFQQWFWLGIGTIIFYSTIVGLIIDRHFS